MSKQVKYFCNLCTEETDKQNLLCVYWDGTKKTGERFGDYRLITDVTSTDKHICKKCFKMIHEFIEQNKSLIDYI